MNLRKKDSFNFVYQKYIHQSKKSIDKKTALVILGGKMKKMKMKSKTQRHKHKFSDFCIVQKKRLIFF